MSEVQASAGKAPDVQTAKTERPPSFKRSAGKWVLIIGGAILLCLLLYRWIGTSVYRGTVQRVYEKESEYRVEFVDLDGNVLVTGNSEIRFPYFKIDTADLHAELNRLALTKDVIDARVWGYRMAWFDMFPNLIEVEFVRSNAARKRAQAEVMTDLVIAQLVKEGAVKDGSDVRSGLVSVIERALLNPPSDAKSFDKSDDKSKP